MKLCLLLILLFAISPKCIAQETDPVANSHFRKALAAAGGEGRFKTIQAPTMWMETGTYFGKGDGVPFVAQYASYWPKRWYRQLIEGRFAIGVDGDDVTLFVEDSNQGRKLSGEKQSSALHSARIGWARLLYPLTDDAYVLTSVPGVEVVGKPTVGIKATHKLGSEVTLYFDKTTFLLMKSEATVFSQEEGRFVKSESYFSDHRSFGGVKLPAKYKLLYDGKLIAEGEATAIKVHATIDPAWFGAEGPARVR